MTKLPKALLGWIFYSLFLNGYGQTFESNSNEDRNFAFQVKHLQEFFERFNNVKTTYITEYIKKNYPGISVDRESLIKGLFNKENKLWKPDQVYDFIQQVTDSASPVYLSFYSPGWFAETQCRFNYLGKPITVTLVLKIEGNEREGSKWLLVSAHSTSIAQEKDTMPSENIVRSKNFINPLSHITYFTGLYKALNDRKHIYDYLDTGFLTHTSSRKFLNALLKKKLVFQYVKKITFHFLQIDGWIFTVNEFERETVNSGWLISSMRKAQYPDKLLYQQKLLE